VQQPNGNGLSEEQQQQLQKWQPTLFSKPHVALWDQNSESQAAPATAMDATAMDATAMSAKGML